MRPKEAQIGDGNMTDKLLTIDELADALGGLGRASIYRHIKVLPGFPQPVKIGAATRFRQSEVQAYIRGDHLITEGRA
jgi:predicted DNA-binding transcriptional regulator AlpA